MCGMIPSPHEGKLRLEAVIYHQIPGLGPSQGTLKATVKAEGRVVSRQTVEAAFPVTAMTLDVPEPRLWSPDDPFLYDLELILETEAGADRVESYFGMRSVKLANGCLYLNGEPLFQRLVLDQGFYPRRDLHGAFGCRFEARYRIGTGGGFQRGPFA